MKKITIFLAFVIILSSLAGCGKEKKFESISTEYFDTVTTVIGYESTKARFDEVAELVYSMLEKYHKLYTAYDSFDGINNIYAVNNSKGKTISVDEKLFELLEYCKEIYSLTEGRTNVAMGSVTEIWHKYRSEGFLSPEDAALPDVEELKNAALHCNIDDIVLDRENLTVRLNDPEMRLDVGAVAKGFAVEMTAKELEARGICGYLINVGGNIRAVGGKNGGEKWTAAIEDPRSNESSPYLAVVSLENASLVTSGSYQRYYTVNGKNYHHIISPDTLFPSENFLSVSVIAPDSGLADALSTALFTLSYEEGVKLAEKNSDVGIIWLTFDGEIYMNEAFEEYLQKQS